MKRVTLILLITTASIYSSSLTATMETGFLAVGSHRIQLSKSGSYFDYRKHGGQDVLFPFTRFNLHFETDGKNSFMLLYQPLKIETEEILQRDLKADEAEWSAGTPMKFLYNFPFYRFSWLREISQRDNFDLAIGASLQIRNATINIGDTAGDELRTSRGVGLVPAFKTLIRWYPSQDYWLAFEADGMYAPVSYLNGSDNEITGAILDASVQSGKHLSSTGSVFLNLRYLGGGAVGTNERSDRLGDGYVKNWLNFFTVSVGFQYRFLSRE